jgi:hypothetical protein
VSTTFAPSPQQIGSRFNLVSAIPITTLVVVVGTLLLAGAPFAAPEPERARQRLEAFGVADLALLIVGSVALALLLSPFQVRFVKWLEGYWPTTGIVGVFERRLKSRHIARWDRLRDGQTTVPGADAKLATLPARGRIMPTSLGNALRHAEDLAGKRYGLGAVEMIPRMWPVRSSQMVAIIDDARNELDVMASFVFVWLVATLVSFGLLYQYGPWLAVPLVTFVLAWISYHGCVAAARAYGQTLVWAFDLYRFALYEQLRIELPSTHKAECVRNKKLMKFLRGRWLAYEDGRPGWAPSYHHPDPVVFQVVPQPRSGQASPSAPEKGDDVS